MQRPGLHEGATMGHLLMDALQRYPARFALADDWRSTTYSELEAELSAAVKAFRSCGLQSGDGIALLMRNRIEGFVAKAAASMMGLRTIALQASAAVDDQAFILQDSGASMLVFDTFYESRLSRLGSLVPRTLSVGDSDCSQELVLRQPDEFAGLTVESSGDQIAQLSYTGGTTGRPKGVMLSHRSMVFSALGLLHATSWPDPLRFLCSAPITHAGGAYIVPVLLQGGSFIIQEGFQPDRFVAAVLAQDATATFMVPTMLYKLLDFLRENEQPPLPLRMLMYGGSPAYPRRISEALDRFGPVLVQIYGQTEAPMVISTLDMPGHSHPGLLASCGRPTLGLRVGILDDGDEPVRNGVVGEVCVRGPLVMDGYWGRPEETFEALHSDWLHTGDLGYFDDEGYLFIVGRSKDMIITGGYNVYAREIEDLLSLHPAIDGAVVVGVPHPVWGEAIHAVLVLRPGAFVTPQELIDWIKQKKGSYAAPKTVEFVTSIPLTVLGKPDKQAIRANLAAVQSSEVRE
jgi:fatty-acyl-CoA synthase